MKKLFLLVALFAIIQFTCSEKVDLKDDLKKVDKDLGMLETVLNGKDDKDVDLNTLLKVLEQDEDKRNHTMHRVRRQSYYSSSGSSSGPFGSSSSGPYGSSSYYPSSGSGSTYPSSYSGSYPSGGSSSSPSSSYGSYKKKKNLKKLKNRKNKRRNRRNRRRTI